MFETIHDQATGLREIFAESGLMVLPMTAVRPGMGYRTMVVNVAASLVKAGQRVVVVDTGPAQIAESLGVQVDYELCDLLSGEREFHEVVGRSAEGIYVLKAALGIRGFIDAAGDISQLFFGFRRLAQPFDVVILAGAVAETAPMTREEDELVMVASNDSQALTATYAAIKQAHTEYGKTAFRILLNRVDDAEAGYAAHLRLADTARRFLGVHVEYAGAIPTDATFAAADRARRSVFSLEPAGEAGRSLELLAEAIPMWRVGRYSLDM
ncbi:MAG: hypothetical protein JNM52_03965 [Betaproteobacteria bacterium]|nr:hypothetical protein [Betaproteobacteria bacterium]